MKKKNQECVQCVIQITETVGLLEVSIRGKVEHEVLGLRAVDIFLPGELKMLAEAEVEVNSTWDRCLVLKELKQEVQNQLFNSNQFPQGQPDCQKSQAVGQGVERRQRQEWFWAVLKNEKNMNQFNLGLKMNKME